MRTPPLSSILGGIAASLITAMSPETTAARARELTPATEVRVGHWLEIRGELREDGVFAAQTVELKEPDRHQLLIGTITSFDRSRGRFEVLGQAVTLAADTELEGLTLGSLDGQFVEVEGTYRGPLAFVADEVEQRTEELERIGGRVDEVSATPRGVVVRIMRYSVLLPATIEHDDPLDHISLAPQRDDSIGAESGFDEDDLFGRGIRLSERLNLAGQIQLESAAETNFDLDREDAEDREEQDGAVRLRLHWLLSRVLYAVGEVRVTQRYRDDEEDGSSTVDQLRAGQTFLYYRHPRSGFDLQLGRQDFDDEREWLYDRNLDGLRFLKSFFPWQLELSATTTLADGSARDEDSTNWIGYLSRGLGDRHLAFFLVHRRIDGDERERPTHLGFRFLTDDAWLDAAWLAGDAGGRDLGGWGIDVGRTFKPQALDPVVLTLAYAVGSGGGGDEGTDRTFRQTGFQDNNAKFDGVTSFRYYGELVDPELSNLHVATFGLGARVARRSSIDLVGHYYRQDEPAEVFPSEIDEDPDGEHRELGWEVDLVYGDRRWEHWDLEAVAGYFVPGDAFPEPDEALLGRVQVRFRF